MLDSGVFYYILLLYSIHISYEVVMAAVVAVPLDLRLRWHQGSKVRSGKLTKLVNLIDEHNRIRARHALEAPQVPQGS